MNTLLELSTPPLLGAFIGYLTNYVAIRMLFRPLHPWKIFGLRLPMTPGVIPAKRHQFAENIGEMVGEHLLTGQDVSRAISGSRFQQDLRELIASRIAELLKKEFGPVGTVIPDRFQTYFQTTVKILRLRLINYLHAYLESEDFSRTIDQVVAGQASALLARPLDRSFPAENREHFYRFLENQIKLLLVSPAVRQWAAAEVERKISSVLSENRSLRDLIPLELAELIPARLEQEAPALLEKIAQLLQQPAMQTKVVDTISRGITNFTRSLGPLAAMMAGFISADTIRAKVSGYLAERGDEIGGWLADEKVRQEAARLLKDKAEELLTTPLTALLQKVAPAKIQELNQEFSAKVSGLLARPATAAALSGILRDALYSQTTRPMAETIAELFGPDAVQQGQQWTAAEIIAVLRSSKVKQLLAELVTTMVEKRLLQKSIGPLAALLPKEVQLSVADYILQQVSELLVREVPGAVDSLNIKRIVTKKVDSLDLLRLEKLLMGIMQEQFKYINLFGGLLGFLIGLLNLLVMAF